MKYAYIAAILILAAVTAWLAQYEPQLGAPSKKTVATSTIIDFLNTYSEETRAEKGSYYTILKENVEWKNDPRLNRYDIPDGFSVNTYDTPAGHGFCVRYEDSREIQNWGFGPSPEVCGEAIIDITPESWIASST